jgi:hypothetical protein
MINLFEKKMAGDIMDKKSNNKSEGEKKSPESLEERLQRYEELHTEEKQKEITDLATRIDKAIVKAIDEFLVREHGADEYGVPLHYHLGDPKEDYKGAYQKADDLIHHIGLSTLQYIFLGINEAQLNVLKEVLRKDKTALQGILAAHGFNAQEFKKEIMTHRDNIYNSEKLKGVISATAAGIATKELSTLERDIFHTDNYDRIRSYTEQKFEEKGFGIKTEGMEIPEMAQHLKNLYLGGISDHYIKQHKGKIYQKKE